MVDFGSADSTVIYTNNRGTIVHSLAGANPTAVLSHALGRGTFVGDGAGYRTDLFDKLFLDHLGELAYI